MRQPAPEHPWIAKARKACSDLRQRFPDFGWAPLMLLGGYVLLVGPLRLPWLRGIDDTIDLTHHNDNGEIPQK